MNSPSGIRQRLTRSDIQARIDKMCHVLFPGASPYTWQYPVERIAEEMSSRGWLKILTDQILPVAKNGSQIRGMFSFSPSEKPKYSISLHIKLGPDDKRLVPTLAHELGHFVLHRDLMENLSFISSEPFVPTPDEERKFGKMALLSERQWMEWRANEFMVALVLPPEGLVKRVVTIQNEIGILNKGFIRIDDQICNSIDASRIITTIADDVMIQRPIVEARLRHLGIIQDVRKQKRLNSADSALDILANASRKGDQLFDFPLPREGQSARRGEPSDLGKFGRDSISLENWIEEQDSDLHDMIGRF